MVGHLANVIFDLLALRVALVDQIVGMLKGPPPLTIQWQSFSTYDDLLPENVLDDRKTMACVRVVHVHRNVFLVGLEERAVHRRWWQKRSYRHGSQNQRLAGTREFERNRSV